MSVKDLGSIFKQAQEMQTKMADVQRDLAEKKVEVSTGGGMVKVVANGINEIISINIDDELISMNDREVLEDLLTELLIEILSANNEHIASW